MKIIANITLQRATKEKLLVALIIISLKKYKMTLFL